MTADAPEPGAAGRAGASAPTSAPLEGGSSGIRSIQPHGVLLGIEPTTWTVVQASTSTAAVLGTAAEDLLGASVVELIGTAAAERVAAVLSGARGATNPVPLELRGRPFDAIVHETQGVVVLELEPALPEHEFAPVLAVLAAVGRIRGATGRDALWGGTVRQLQDLTGFDRVIVLDVHADGSGQVVAEARADESMAPFDGRRIPASEMTGYAGDFSLATSSRTIVSTDEPGAPIRPPWVPSSGALLDLERAELRTVPARTLEVARRLGHASSLSFPLLVENRPVGVIVCAHREPRRLPYTLRQSLAVLAGEVAAQLASISEIERLTHATELAETRSRLLEQFRSTDDLAQALFREPTTVLDLVPAIAAALHIDGVTSTIGNAPDTAGLSRVVERLRADRTPLPVVIDALETEHPHLARLLPSVGGLLIVPVDGDRGYLVWFRPSVREAGDGLGDPVRSWQGLADAAVQLSRELDAAIAGSRHWDLARFGFHDGLTGLPNRRLLINRIEHALAGRSRGASIALLHIGVDSLHAVIDAHGHDRGDEVLVQTAERLRSVTRVTDLVARLPGDEFVVLAGSINAGSSARIAVRVLEALHRPFTVAGWSLTVTFSVGAAEADDHDTADDLMRRAAAAARYWAKQPGSDPVAD